jgi:cyclopropane fatty-acyl-phospholipid synthase-like methyltransferase
VGALGFPDGPWFNEIAEYLGPAYLRNSFTMGTTNEIDFLVTQLELGPGKRVLDVGCGPGRHSLALARRGIAAHGVDLSPDFIELATKAAAAEDLPATFEEMDVRALPVDGEYDAALCLCQGGFGLLGGDADDGIIERIGRAVRPGGAVAISAFSAAFAVRWLEDGEHFDPRTGVLHEHATIRNETGDERVFEMWTTCFTVRELTLMARNAGLRVEAVHGVRPGAYAIGAPTIELPELLLFARRPEAR